MDERDLSRYSRSHYGSRAGREGRHEAEAADHDEFFDDLRISAADPNGVRTVADYSRKAVEESLSSGQRSRSAQSDRRSLRTRSQIVDGQGRSQSQGDGQDATTRETHPRQSVRNVQPNRGRTFKIAIIALVAVVVVGVGTAFAYYSGIMNNLHKGVDDDLRAALVETDMAKEPFYLLLLGTDGSVQRDTYEDFGGQYRSDSIMLARIDPVEQKVALISIARDIEVDLGGDYGEQKINAAYAFGGPALAVKAVSKLANVPISHYAQVDFDGFEAIVNSLGGVDVDVPIDIDDWEAGGSLSAGEQTLNGAQALILCRSRESYTATAAHPDEMRTANQRLVLSAIAKKALSSDIATIANTVSAMSEYVTTDLELTDIIGLAQVMKGLDPDTAIYTASVPTTSKYIDGGWYEYVNKDEWATMMKRVEEGLPPVEEAIVDEATGTVMATAGSGSYAESNKQAAVVVKNATDTPGLAAKTRSKLMEAGFTNVVVGEITDSTAYPETLVIYDLPGQAHEAEEIVKTIGQGRALLNDGSYLLLDTDFIVVIGENWEK